MMTITIIIIIIAPICQSTWIDIDAVYEDVAAQTFAQPTVPGDQSLMITFMMIMIMVLLMNSRCLVINH